MRIVEWIQRHTIGSLVVSFALGAALSILVIGVPKLWSAEAAGWASAVGAIAAVAVALRLADVAQRRRDVDRRAAGKLAFVSLWPGLHRAQAQTLSVCYLIQQPTLAAEELTIGRLISEISALEEELRKLGAQTVHLDSSLSLRLAGAVALAGYVARQARRLTEEGSVTSRAALQKSHASEWASDARSAAGQLLQLSQEAEAAGNAITGRKPLDKASHS